MASQERRVIVDPGVEVATFFVRRGGREILRRSQVIVNLGGAFSSDGQGQTQDQVRSMIELLREPNKPEYPRHSFHR